MLWKYLTVISYAWPFNHNCTTRHSVHNKINKWNGHYYVLVNYGGISLLDTYCYFIELRKLINCFLKLKQYITVAALLCAIYGTALIITFSFYTSLSSICHSMDLTHTSQWISPLSFIWSGCLTKVLKVNMNTVHSVRVTVSSLFTQLHVYHNFHNSQSPLQWNPGKP